MNFSLTPEQEMLREAAVDALSRIDTVSGAIDRWGHWLDHVQVGGPAPAA